jgi:hypothetical protein
MMVLGGRFNARRVFFGGGASKSLKASTKAMPVSLGDRPKDTCSVGRRDAKEEEGENFKWRDRATDSNG